VARATEQPEILEAALAAAVSDRDDVVSFPTRLGRAPLSARRAIASRRFRARPFSMRFGDVEAAQLAGAFIALADLLPDVRRAAADFPLMDACVTAERPSWRRDRSAAPTANRLTGLVPHRLAPFFGGDDAPARGTHTNDIGRYAGDLAMFV
jgi:hypothetical protein